MVNLSAVLFRRSPFGTKPDGHWRKRQILKMSAHFASRTRNCFTIAIRRVQRALQNVVKGRQLRKERMVAMWNLRITAGCQELGYLPRGAPLLIEGLARSHILLNRQSLSNFAIWEPRTFKAINKLAAVKVNEDHLTTDTIGPIPKGVNTRRLLRDD